MVWLLDALAWPFSFVVDGALAIGLGAAATICVCVAVIRCILFPLSVHQARSQWVLASIRPQVAALHERYRRDPEGVRVELLALYATHRVSPFGFAAVIIPQAFALLGLYWALREHFADLSGSALLPDLNDPARLSGAGVALMVLYVVGFSAAMWISAKRLAADVSKFILALMAAVPAGALVALPIMTVGMALYLAATAAASFLQAVVLWRLYPRRDETPTAEGVASGGPAAA